MTETTPPLEPEGTQTDDTAAFALAVDENEAVGDLDEQQEIDRRREIQAEDF
jgi:hypothetical protein